MPFHSDKRKMLLPLEFIHILAARMKIVMQLVNFWYKHLFKMQYFDYVT